ncbi:hypothetical protein GF337_03700 [candidate division KSB1 bacterium]|nr:hypothetical protein [candidate division KSB1 bacterium]
MYDLISFVLILIFITGTEGFAKSGNVRTDFPAPEHFPTGLTYDGSSLWSVDRKTDMLYRIDPKSGEVLSSLPAPGYSPTGLAYDGSYLWCIDDKEKLLYRIDPETGVAVRIIEAYTSSPRDICWDGKLLWVVDNRLDLVLSIDPEDGMMITKFDSPAKDPDGITFDGKYLWITDRGRDMIYRVVPENGMVVAALHAPHNYARGLAWDGKSLWNIDYESDRVYQITLDDDQFIDQRDTTDQRLYNFFDFRNYGPGKVTKLNVYIAIPEDRPNQKLLRAISFDPQPTEIIADKWGQKVAHYEIENLEQGKFFRAVMTVDASVMAAEYYIDPDRCGTLDDIPRDIKNEYLVDGKKLMIYDPFIEELAQKIVGDEKNPYWIARKIFNYLIDHLSYNLKPVGGWNTAPTVLKRGTASCSEYSFSFIALSRAVGLPARYVGAVSRRGDDASLDEVFHRWCEVYLPNYGWVPFDANKGDSKLPADQASGIGNISRRYIITTTSGGNSEYMDWTYNFNHKWQSTGKCRIYTEHYGEWSPLENDQ